MKKLANARDLLNGLSVSLAAGAGALQSFVLDKANAFGRFSDNERSAYISSVSVLTIFVVSLALMFVVKKLIDRSRRFRRLLLRTDFIEGAWIDIVYDQFNKEVIGGGLLHIILKEESVRVKGETFNHDGSAGGQFLSTLSGYDEEDQTIDFVYTINLDNREIFQADGLGRYSFQANGLHSPRSFWGHFYANGVSNRFDVYGEKLSSKEELHLLQASLAERGQAVAEFIARHGPLIIPQEWRKAGRDPDPTPAPAD